MAERQQRRHLARARDDTADGRPCTRAARRAEPSAAARVGREAEAGARSELLRNELGGLERSQDGPPELEAVAPAPSALAVPSALDHLRHTRPISVQPARWAGGARRTHPTSPDVAPSLPWPRGELGRATRGTPAASGRSARRHASVATMAIVYSGYSLRLHPALARCRRTSRVQGAFLHVTVLALHLQGLVCVCSLKRCAEEVASLA
jgi:hypothetical protein